VKRAGDRIHDGGIHEYSRDVTRSDVCHDECTCVT